MTTTSLKLGSSSGSDFYDPDKSKRVGQHGGAELGGAHEVLMKNAQHLPNEIITEPLSGP